MIRMCVYILFFTVFSGVSSDLYQIQWLNSAQAEDDDREDEAGEEVGSSLELEECHKNKNRYEFLKNYKIECEKDYILYEALNVQTVPQREIQIGSFNIMRIAQSQSRFKKYDMVAEIMNQWDLVAVVEIMSTPSREIVANQQTDEVLKQFEQNKNQYTDAEKSEYREAIEETYWMSRYLVLLKELRKLDPSWSLIMSAEGTGEGGAPEYAGFYYRSSAVKNTPAFYCAGAKGCSAKIDDKDIVSRLPFVSEFSVNQQKFLAVALHLRFRPACQNETSTQCKVYSTKAKEILKELEEFPEDDQNRFVELFELQQSVVQEKTKTEVLIMGDFNLEYKKKNHKAWRSVLDNEKLVVLNEAKTSISALKGIDSGKNYDHFIFDPSGDVLQKCSTASAKDFNFVLDLDTPKTDIPALKELSQFLDQRNDDSDVLVDLFKTQTERRRKVTSCQRDGCEVESFFAREDVQKEVSDYRKRVAPGDSKRPYAVYHELISDHIPIQITCNF